ncbi:cytochrome c oxidase subunit 3 [Mucisphaera calidilacus]|uniref:Cytochrome o ubiquinol oxidase subunit III n=1 Tax=Mucisphaera calidilacus TaxID=2527982 RepID=A0A518C0D9_9BACT|nr:cytochrome c oxidase subunit 3 [Mucisphaera calidilacus]QDU72682.1 cytochrome o ubiquinol oxidase subunit III [Mucisphaera calidilacus]
MSDANDHGHGEGHHPHLAHHFHTPKQQFESAKLGIWLFLATEILMFGGLFCAYAIYRGNHKEVYLYAHKFLDTQLGAINTAVLLASSLTMAWAVRAAMLGQKKLLSAMLLLTFMGGVGFMGIKSIEYSSKWGSGLWPGQANAYYPIKDPTDTEGQAQRLNVINNYLDRKYLGKYIYGDDYDYKTDPKFYDPHHGHGYADGHDHAHDEEHAEQEGETHEAEHDEGHDDGHGEHAEPTHGDMTAELPEDYVPVGGEAEADEAGVPVEVSLIAEPEQAGSGVTSEFAGMDLQGGGHHAGHHKVITFMDLPVAEQDRVHIFYQIYYMMTGLHGIHVLVGMGLLLWLWIRATFMNAFGPDNFTTIECVGLYWHIVDMIWIFLFPLLYLIH